MRQVHTHHGKPGYADHFQQDEPFSDIPPPVFSFIGSARLPLRLLANQLPTSATIPIVCPYTMEALGSCRIDLAASAYASSSGIQTPESVSRKLANPLQPGQKVTISLAVDNVRGMSSDDFASVHAQLRLTSLLGPQIASEDTYASLPVDLDQFAISQLSLRRTLTVITTTEMIKWLSEEAATLDFFAKVRPAYLDRLTRWDKKREPATSGPVVDTPSKRPEMRRNETDFVAPEQHDVLADVRVLELGNDGEYVPADVVDEVLQLHQGLQRRLQIRLAHTSGKSLPWTKLSHVSVGDVRVRIKGADEVVSADQVELKTSSEVAYGTDGCATLTATAAWDTTAHNAVQMNRKTPPDQSISLKLLFLLAVDTLDELAVFELDLAVRILDRDARRSSFKFWSSAKVYPSTTAIYSLDLAAPMAQSADELWRLDTAQKHVPGQEVLGDWKPRSLTLIKDHVQSQRIQRMAGDVQLTKAVLGLHGDVEEASKVEGKAVELCLDMWMREMDQRMTVSFHVITWAGGRVSRSVLTTRST
jgi:kinesin family protein 1